MFAIDHIPVWTTDRDGPLSELSKATGLPILQGYAPSGRVVARGVRFANGPFIDVHQADAVGPALLGLAGDVDLAEQLAAQNGWRTRLSPRLDGPDAEPWSLTAFRRKQGVLSLMFVVAYDRDPSAWSSPVFNGGLYDAPPRGSSALQRVWITAQNPAEAGEAVTRLGFSAAGEIRSRLTPFRGQLYGDGRAALVISEGAEDAVVRFDADGRGSARVIEVAPGLSAVVGDEGAPTQQG